MSEINSFSGSSDVFSTHLPLITNYRQVFLYDNTYLHLILLICRYSNKRMCWFLKNLSNIYKDA
jgi:hypothetical protein